MDAKEKKELSESDIKAKFITPAIIKAGWDEIAHIRREVKAELDNFIDPESRYPVIATTSELLTTGVDAKTCKLIVLDKSINSMTTFKQIVGRGTRIDESHNKYFFTILDFKKATELFKDAEFDGEPVCWRRLNIDHQCQSNFDQGLKLTY